MYLGMYLCELFFSLWLNQLFESVDYVFNQIWEIVTYYLLKYILATPPPIFFIILILPLLIGLW
jgi:hypothetical protein